MTSCRRAATVLAALGLASVLALPFGLGAAGHALVVADPPIRADALHVFPGQVLEGNERAAGDQRIHQAHLLRNCVLN